MTQPYNCEDCDRYPCGATQCGYIVGQCEIEAEAEMKADLMRDLRECDGG